MAIKRPIALTASLPGFTPLKFSGTLSDTAAINTTTTKTITPATPIVMSTGYVRIKGTGFPGAGAGVCSGIKVTMTDGTTTVTVVNLPTFAASELMDITRTFNVDIGATSISVAITMTNVANGQMTFDFEVGAN